MWLAAVFVCMLPAAVVLGLFVFLLRLGLENSTQSVIILQV